ncbi:MAG: Phenylacetic acid catabolic protein [Alphaproteobacteria bacterium]
MSQVPTVATCEELHHQPAEYQSACQKIVISHAINELYGCRVFDEPAIALAPNPYAKWLTCRVAMEEYGHHYRFFELGREMGIAEGKMLPEMTAKQPLSIFAFKMKTWTDFVVIKMVGDLAEILQVEDLVQCSFVPLRNLARMTMPEERFHAQFGEDFARDLIEKRKGKAEVQEALDKIFPSLPAFFGKSGSANNAMYRKWGLKKRTNEEMRDDYIRRAKELVEKLGLKLPAVKEAA